MKNEEKNQIAVEKKPFRNRYMLAAGVILLLTIASLVFIWFTQEAPKSDPGREAIIRQLAAKQLYAETGIKKDPNELTDHDFAQITQLLISGKELCDIKILEKFTNLEQLRLYSIRFPENAIPKWMKILAKIGVYNINKRFVIELKPLAKLNHLQSLKISDSPINNIKALSSLINLQKLTLQSTQVTELEPIKELTNIKTLAIFDTPISDLEPIKGLKNLETLSLPETKM